jgi:hypothetical protein
MKAAVLHAVRAAAAAGSCRTLLAASRLHAGVPAAVLELCLQRRVATLSTPPPGETRRLQGECKPDWTLLGSDCVARICADSTALADNTNLALELLPRHTGIIVRQHTSLELAAGLGGATSRCRDSTAR